MPTWLHAQDPMRSTQISEFPGPVHPHSLCQSHQRPHTCRSKPDVCVTPEREIRGARPVSAYKGGPSPGLSHTTPPSPPFELLLFTTNFLLPTAHLRILQCPSRDLSSVKTMYSSSWYVHIMPTRRGLADLSIRSSTSLVSECPSA